jgi:hypothetical protein
MVDGIDNPYRADRLAEALFVGREALLSELCAAARSGRNAVRAVMGGRGMGKTSLARQIEIRLAADALTMIVAGDARAVMSQIGTALRVDLTAEDSVRRLIVAAHQQGSVAIVIDEIEKLLDDPEGVSLLENLRHAYERRRADQKLAIFVLGGTAVRDLLQGHASPFLRIAGGFHTLAGLERDEVASLLRLPLDLDIPDAVVDALWIETGGHPWLLQMFMEHAVDAAPSRAEVAAQLPAGIQKAEPRLHEIAFPIWWERLRARGQDVYRILARQKSAVPRDSWVRRFGDDPQPWLHVLASTGVAVLDDEAVIARGTLFQRWVEQSYPARPMEPAPAHDALGTWLTDVGVDPFEHLVVRALGAWARATVEFPAAALKQDAHVRAGNDGLSPEAFFQMHAIVALLQHERDITAEPEALSMRPRGRSDIKVRSRHDVTRRACVELKIYGRDDGGVVRQVIGYAAPGDTFAAIVSVDRYQRPLRQAFEGACFEGAVPAATREAPAGVVYPAFFTEHARESGDPLRVWHFLVQLRDA